MSDCIGTSCKAESLMQRIRELQVELARYEKEDAIKANVNKQLLERAEKAEAKLNRLLNALIGVVKVADRATDEFDEARAAINEARGHE